MIVTDWIEALAAFGTMAIAVWAAIVGLRTFAEQRTANDVNTALAIFSEINRYWDRISTPGSDYQYNIGQILVHFEIASALFNRNVLTSTASIILADHMVEVLTMISSSENGRHMLDRIRSSNTTFDELKKFSKHRFPQALNTLAFSTERRNSDSAMTSQ